MKAVNDAEKLNIVRKIARINIAVNVLLVLLKLTAGVLGHSSALISDAVHSASDVLSIIIVAAGVRMSAKAADTEHEYGHERIECLASIILAAILCATGLTIGLNGIRNAFAPSDLHPGLLALAAAAVSIAVKEIMFRYTARAARRADSSALMADAWHSRSDALSSVGSLAGVALARLGFSAGDALAAVIISALIIKASAEIFIDAAKKLTDTSCGESTERSMAELAEKTPGVLRVDSIRTRRFGSKIYVDMELSAAADISFSEAHEIAEKVHSAVEDNFDGVKHCTVHMNPLYEDRI